MPESHITLPYDIARCAGERDHTRPPKGVRTVNGILNR